MKGLSKFIFGFPISLFFGIGILVSTDIIQPSYFKNLSIYYPYFIIALFVGYLSVFLAGSYIGSLNKSTKAYFFMIVYMIFEGLFSLLAVNTYYGDQSIPLLRQISALSLPFVFSLFYFLNLIESEKPDKIVKSNIDEKKLFKDFDDLECRKPTF